jgi:hypothetical protein
VRARCGGGGDESALARLISGTKSDGRGPFALQIAVRMSSSFRPSKGDNE